MSKLTGTRSALRVLAAVVSFGLLIVVVFCTLSAHRKSAQPPPVRVFDDTVKLSYPVRLDASRNLFQVGLLLAGGMWALLLGKKSETGINLWQWQELLMFVVLNACFVGSFVAHHAYTDRLSTWIASGVTKTEPDQNTAPTDAKDDKPIEKQGKEWIEIPDVDDSSLTVLLDWQMGLFVLGTVVSLVAFVSARFLQE